MMIYFYECYVDCFYWYWMFIYFWLIINFFFYVSWGYVIFILDVYYWIGYLGESVLDVIIIGVIFLLDQGFIDKERLGVQGYSWGGYQVVYLII